jgi:hypothetical protein
MVGRGSSLAYAAAAEPLQMMGIRTPEPRLGPGVPRPKERMEIHGSVARWCGPRWENDDFCEIPPYSPPERNQQRRCASAGTLPWCGVVWCGDPRGDGLRVRVRGSLGRG